MDTAVKLEDLYNMVKQMQIENAELKQRIRILEGHLGLDNFWYDELIEKGIIPFCDQVKHLQEGSARTEAEEQIITLRRELEKKLVLRTKDVMALFGLKHYEQARRLMKKTAELHKDLVFENDNHKGHRIRISRVDMNNVRIIGFVNKMCAQN